MLPLRRGREILIPLFYHDTVPECEEVVFKAQLFVIWNNHIFGEYRDTQSALGLFQTVLNRDHILCDTIHGY